ncbi:hypothetical protein TCAL_04821 [Tigriopus californicus]|uniref:26S proteasome non-ATPase regulatory subunit 5 n=1 Tax=Tigriopus californicus TaxID=6832 RepID=A0A553NXI3_TIGCA|nr:26S proteasome non-ATPase regulatory subunit 5-like [Tigriopus californicus]TRY70138.1 hypothetical protein TCAL_04821 [Tigriopus californicus]|eukprot:TCALIF_04821-PA protein Name:"Similar to PSMD5 26S proteasome non-ATPase regulatory subunit 5 (Bos taurus)" AED:0.03 eAED:0.03 QI:791/1/1/1/0.75/0.8/5/238/519
MSEDEDFSALASMETFMSRLSLAPVEEKTSILQNILPLIGDIAQKPEWKASVSQSNLHILFDCFNTSSEEEMNIAGQVLQKIAAIIPPQVMIKKYSQNIKRCLEHPDSVVKKANLKALHVCLTGQSQAALDELAANQPLLNLVTQKIRDPDLAVSKEAIIVLEDVASIGRLETNPFFNQGLLAMVKDLSQDKDEKVRMRTYDLAVSISRLSPEHLERIKPTSLIKSLVHEVITDDVLIQLNAIEVLTLLARSEHCQVYLDECNVFSELNQMIDSISSGPMANFLVPGFVKLFGVVAQSHKEDCFEKFPNFKSTLQSMLDGNDQIQQILAIETYGFICQNPVKKIDLANRQFFVEGFMPVLSKYLKTGIANLRSKAMHVLDDLMTTHYEPGENLNNEWRVNQAILRRTDPNPLMRLLEYSRLPFPEVTIITHSVLLKLVEQPFALKMFQSTPGFMESLLDRTVSQTKEVILLKFRILERITQLELSREIFPPEVAQKVAQYVQNGPFHAGSQVHVAFGEL